MFRITFAIAAMALPVAASAAPPAISGTTFIKKAGASDQYEIQSSRLVTGSTNAKVRDFAEQMIRDHTKSTGEVKAAARQAGLTVPPPALEPMQARMIAELRRTPVSRRDTVYITQQKRAHQMALELHRGYAADGKVAPLKAAAGQIAPVVQHHIEELNRM